jgi:molybdate transport system substrate-binding protein
MINWVRHRQRSLSVGLVCIGCVVAALPAPSSRAAATTARSSTAKRPARTTSALRAATTTRPPSRRATSTTLPRPTASTTPAPTTRERLNGSITVFAASSLTASFTEIATDFERVNPGVSVRLNFGGSATLVTQILNGAPADVFASADSANMNRLREKGLLSGRPTTFARNRLMIVVPKGNPLRVDSLGDLARPEVVVALGAPGVPAGDYAREILDRAGVTVTPKTLESSVAAIVTKAALKEIDAGIVYVTDVAVDDYRVDGIAIADTQNLIASYPIAATSSSKNQRAADSFVSYTTSPAAQKILGSYKFLPIP